MAARPWLGFDVGELTKANFDRLHMFRTSPVWRDDFAGNLADGWNGQWRLAGQVRNKRSYKQRSTAVKHGRSTER